MHLLLAGMNHRSASLSEREALALDLADIGQVLGSAKGSGTIQETVVLSTCNRTEFYARAADADQAFSVLRDAVRKVKTVDALAPGAAVYRRDGAEAVRHAFRVTAGLDSMVLGDLQVLGQVKDAYALAKDSGATGPWMEHLFESALHAGKRARTETSIGTGVVSVGSAACELARRHMPTLEGRRVLVIGAGETSRIAAKHLAQHCSGGVTLANRTLARAEALAAQLGVRAVPFEDIDGVLADTDLVLSATRAPSMIITEQALRTAMAQRGDRPMVIIDLAVPRDVEPSAATIPGVTLHSIDAIQGVVDRTLARRAAEVPRVEAILDEEMARFEAWQWALDAAPVVRDLRDHFERVRLEEFERALANASDEERARAERLTRALVNRLLHVPTVRLKNLDPASDEGAGRLRAARELFALEGRDHVA
jgi:glutamyl-tRNA reductase